MQLWFAGTAIIFPIEIVYERWDNLVQQFAGAEPPRRFSAQRRGEVSVPFTPEIVFTAAVARQSVNQTSAVAAREITIKGT
jgi:hypothetical protein